MRLSWRGLLITFCCWLGIRKRVGGWCRGVMWGLMQGLMGGVGVEAGLVL